MVSFYNNEEVLIWWLKTQLFPEILAGMGVQAPQRLLRAPHQLFQAPHLVPCVLRCFVQALHLLLSIPQLGIQNLRSEPLQQQLRIGGFPRENEHNRSDLELRWPQIHLHEEKHSGQHHSDLLQRNRQQSNHRKLLHNRTVPQEFQQEQQHGVFNGKWRSKWRIPDGSLDLARASDCNSN
jgi:hypothetical protein